MSGGKERRLFRIILQNFIDSLRPRPIKGNLMGKDYLGNTYFEIPADPSRGKRKPSRWFDPRVKEDFEQSLPSEWESWLRGRRAEPPTEDEITRNLAIMKMKKENAAKLELEQKRERAARGDLAEPVAPVQKTGADSFPKYEEYHYGKEQDR